jgi:hypothetical protein
MSGLRETFEALRPKLVTFRDARKRELFDLPKAPRPDEDCDAPVRFVPDFDNLVLSHEDRSRIMADEHRAQVTLKNLQVRRDIPRRRHGGGDVGSRNESGRRRYCSSSRSEPSRKRFARRSRLKASGCSSFSRRTRRRGKFAGRERQPRSPLRDRSRRDVGMELSLRRWKPGQLLLSWGAYWVGLVGVSMGPAIRATWRATNLPDQHGTINASFNNGTLSYEVIENGVKTLTMTGQLSTVLMWVVGPPLLMWIVWLLVRERPAAGGQPEALSAGAAEGVPR